jgi:predicted  nucleic acid-binding Zn-ribbon protein
MGGGTKMDSAETCAKRELILQYIKASEVRKARPKKPTPEEKADLAKMRSDPRLKKERKEVREFKKRLERAEYFLEDLYNDPNTAAKRLDTQIRAIETEIYYLNNAKRRLKTKWEELKQLDGPIEDLL